MKSFSKDGWEKIGASGGVQLVKKKGVLVHGAPAIEGLMRGHVYAGLPSWVERLFLCFESHLGYNGATLLLHQGMPSSV